MAIRLLKLADPLATSTAHWTLSWDDDAAVVTACSDAGIAASAGSVFIETWSIWWRRLRRAIDGVAGSWWDSWVLATDIVACRNCQIDHCDRRAGGWEERQAFRGRQRRDGAIDAVGSVNAIDAICSVGSIDAIGAVRAVGAVSSIGARGSIGAVRATGPIGAVGAGGASQASVSLRARGNPGALEQLLRPRAQVPGLNPAVSDRLAGDSTWRDVPGVDQVRCGNRRPAKCDEQGGTGDND